MSFHMDKAQELFSSFIDSVCGKFACMEAATPLQEGFRAFCESTHTARAVEVRKAVNLLMDRISKWISKERAYIGRSGHGEPLDEPIFISENDLCDLDWDDPESYDKIADFDQGLTIRMSLVEKDDDEVSFQYYHGLNLVDINILSLVGEWMYYNSNATSPLVRGELKRFDRLARELENGDRITPSILDGIENLLDTNLATEIITHELTHYIQDQHGELHNGIDEVAKYGIKPDDFDMRRHHEFLPWEIDADVQGHLVNIINMKGELTPTEMAKAIYNIFIHSRRNEGRIPEELRKQCWETAASLARAVSMAPDMDGYDIDAIIKHLDDYAV